MPSDMRDELVQIAAGVTSKRHGSMWTASEIIDSIPPGSFKREDGTWGRLAPTGVLTNEARTRLYTEVDHVE